MRYLPLTEGDRANMLAEIGVPSIDDLFVDVPDAARFDGTFDLPDHMAEFEVEQRMSAMASLNVTGADVPSFLGAGAYRHHVPASVDHLIQRGEFLTSYTPYQPEISQGTLQALFEFQTMVALITGMEVANASMYDGATSCAEAALMARRVTRRARCRALRRRASTLHRRHLRRRLKYVNIDSDDPRIAAGSGGRRKTSRRIGRRWHAACVDRPVTRACLVASATCSRSLSKTCRDESWRIAGRRGHRGNVALGALRSPGEMGADVVAAEGRNDRATR